MKTKIKGDGANFGRLKSALRFVALYLLVNFGLGNNSFAGSSNFSEAFHFVAFYLARFLQQMLGK